jgi:hypothetical protein
VQPRRSGEDPLDLAAMRPPRVIGRPAISRQQ